MSAKGSQRAAGLLRRLPRRNPVPHPHDSPDRKHICHDSTQVSQDTTRWFSESMPDDDVQTGPKHLETPKKTSRLRTSQRQARCSPVHQWGQRKHTHRKSRPTTIPQTHSDPNRRLTWLLQTQRLTVTRLLPPGDRAEPAEGSPQLIPQPEIYFKPFSLQNALKPTTNALFAAESRH